MKFDSFEKWLADELSLPDDEHYDPDGDSSLAVMRRLRSGKLKTLCWEYRHLFYTLKYEAKRTRWPEANLEWIMLWLIFPLTITVLPVLKAFLRVESAKAEFSALYNRYVRKKRMMSRFKD
ncbi:hypothetical protein [Vibrio sp. OPT18]|uniref:hypothetical protein n=1 Tax=Vibrio sp. OPT18 TaxID=2778641 RepID=UPI00187FDE5C|nr:hypothetical protein [Vibrio sp. OPT18]MBE8578621.1 hypothetical protein [Vibrio sp. OPT18]